MNSQVDLTTLSGLERHSLIVFSNSENVISDITAKFRPKDRSFQSVKTQPQSCIFSKKSSWNNKRPLKKMPRWYDQLKNFLNFELLSILRFKTVIMATLSNICHFSWSFVCNEFYSVSVGRIRIRILLYDQTSRLWPILKRVRKLRGHIYSWASS